MDLGEAAANLGEAAFQRPLEKPRDGGSRDAVERADAVALTTYRYLRLAMVVVAAAIILGVVKQAADAGCWQGSISAYYYTPAGPIFVSGMVAMAVALVVIKGSTVAEDLLLNAAGFVAPIVAFLPTTLEPACEPGQPLVPGAGGPLPQNIVDEVNNNLWVLLVAGALALLAGSLAFAVEQRRGDRATTQYVRGRVALLATTAVALVVGVWLYLSGAVLDLHGWSAVVMFGFLALASIWDGATLVWLDRKGGTTTDRWRLYAGLYLAVGVGMILGGAFLQYVIPDPWSHRTLVLELVEIALFGAMWSVQSVERWNRIMQGPKDLDADARDRFGSAPEPVGTLRA